MPEQGPAQTDRAAALAGLLALAGAAALLCEVVWLRRLSLAFGSTGLALTTGVQSAASTLDDSGSSGAILAIGAGTVVGFTASSFELRTGFLRARHVPPGIPGVRLVSRGATVAPAGATFAPDESDWLGRLDTIELPPAAGSANNTSAS